MEDALVIISLIFLAFMCIGAGYGCTANIMAYKRQKQMRMPTTIPAADDAMKSARNIGFFLWRYSRKAGTHDGTETASFKNASKLGDYDVILGKSHDMIAFIRMCHTLGCEVVIRKVAQNNQDIEEDPERIKDILAHMDWRKR